MYPKNIVSSIVISKTSETIAKTLNINKCFIKCKLGYGLSDEFSAKFGNIFGDKLGDIF